MWQLGFSSGNGRENFGMNIYGDIYGNSGIQLFGNNNAFCNPNNFNVFNNPMPNYPMEHNPMPNYPMPNYFAPNHHMPRHHGRGHGSHGEDVLLNIFALGLLGSVIGSAMEQNSRCR